MRGRERRGLRIILFSKGEEFLAGELLESSNYEWEQGEWRSCLICEEFFRLFGIVMHAETPEEFFRKNDANICGEALGTPGDGGVASFCALSMGVLLGNIFGIFIRARSFFEP